LTLAAQVFEVMQATLRPDRAERVSSLQDQRMTASGPLADWQVAGVDLLKRHIRMPQDTCAVQIDQMIFTRPHYFIAQRLASPLRLNQ
jgi:hypothetical protein